MPAILADACRGIIKRKSRAKSSLNWFVDKCINQVKEALQNEPLTCQIDQLRKIKNDRN